MSVSFLQIASEIGALVEKKNAAYGSSFAKSGAFLRLLYPNGVRPEQMDDALLVARIFDKLQRIATDRDALDESPYRDIAGYGILGASMHDVRIEKAHDEDRSSKPQLSTPVSTARMHPWCKVSGPQVLQRRLPHEGLSHAQRKTKAGALPALRKTAKKARKAGKSS